MMSCIFIVKDGVEEDVIMSLIKRGTTLRKSIVESNADRADEKRTISEHADLSQDELPGLER